ncbi:NAD(P)/FAD-dependent oxidoreductase [Polynucleobacter sp. HIN6]|uniref:NAD(P)/FAD-dependent oxidoreductase n=1 Tax=Polynucleobacter sp. HIN6 TaxID=3047865 RepID=UPI0025744254|nr:NAD(P)/FAD-dependent oxidoreductase [Polynucleobacter sp. HIN6]BEI35116.1 NAD(P)/FAD-dependent oxidoreductase [Polynucleobacter sp. HIN6]
MIWDAIIVGGGAAGLFCAGIAGQRGKKVLVLDHAPVLGEKIRISGGGRCNFTNLNSAPEHFLSLNPHFVKSPLARYSSKDFINLVREYRIPFHEKHRGQLFCDDSAKDVIQMLLAECHKGGVTIQHPVSVTQIIKSQSNWTLETTDGIKQATHLIIATGGLPVPAIGASDFALRIAKQFEIPTTSVRPALVPLAFTSDEFSVFTSLAGISLEASVQAGQRNHGYGTYRFDEDLLITHKGLSGPAILQASSYWHEGEAIHINWLGKTDFDAIFSEAHQKTVDAALAEVLPQRVAQLLTEQLNLAKRNWAEVSKKDREALRTHLTKAQMKPAGTLGWKKAEVMLGGVDTKALDGKTMMAKQHQNLYFIGECVDVTGHLGGHNFQWAWSSAFVCANSLIN